MPFLDREHFTPHFFSEKRQGTVTGAVATLLGTLLGMYARSGEMLLVPYDTSQNQVLNQQQRNSQSHFRKTEVPDQIAMRAIVRSMQKLHFLSRGGRPRVPSAGSLKNKKMTFEVGRRSWKLEAGKGCCSLHAHFFMVSYIP